MPTQVEIYEKLGSIDTKLDQLLKSKDDHEDRLRSLEKFKFYALGVVAMLTFVGTKAWEKVFG